MKRVSVAVLVDGSYAKSDKGDMTYQPRSKEELDRITALVKSAIGFEQKRGDLVEVVNLRFADSPVVQVAEEEKPVVDIMSALKQSIEQAKAKKKPMEKAKGKKQPAVEAKPAKEKKQKAG